MVSLRVKEEDSRWADEHVIPIPPLMFQVVLAVPFRTEVLDFTARLPLALGAEPPVECGVMTAKAPDNE
jgi:hypothetical protein